MTTISKPQLIQDLKNSFMEIIDWINAQPQNQFNEELVLGKWPISGHLYHLIKSTKAVSKGMSMPKMGLQTMFGKCNREERSYQETLDKYETSLVKNNMKTKNNYEAEPGRIFDRSVLIKRYETELSDLIESLDKWNEDDMSTYVMPHPIMGKFTIREFIYFTIFHTKHHLSTLKEKYVLS